MATSLGIKTYNGVTVQNAVEIHPADFYTNDTGYHSLVNPAILKNSGDCLELTYKVRRLNPVAANTVVGLRFRYSDGNFSTAPTLDNTANYQTFTATSLPNKSVIAIELGWINAEYLHLGSVSLTGLQTVDRIDSRLAGEVLINNQYSCYEYDNLGRLTDTCIKTNKAGTQVLENTYTYLDKSFTNGCNTSYTVNRIKVSSDAGDIVDYRYVYNAGVAGSINAAASNPYNIYQIKEGTVLKAEYFYDVLGRLIRENNQYTTQTVLYAYDLNNNITSKTIYSACTFGSGTPGGSAVVMQYTYDSTFKDRLVSYGAAGQQAAITYDGGASGGIGLPSDYFGKALSWTGRELTGYVYGSNTLSFSYDDEGLRRTKTVNGVTTEYIYNGTALLRQKTGSDKMYFIYDQNGVTGVQLNGTTYYYVRNLQGDVTKLVTSAGTVVVQYVYDSWGKVKVCDAAGNQNTSASFIGNKNPIRYRGYYYDTETSLYYLGSRYYDPEVGRFISPDKFENLLTEAMGHISGANVYTYCYNNPIMYSDPSGEGFFTALIIGALVFGLVNTGAQLVGDVINYAATGQWSSGWEDYAGAFIGGFAGGATFVASSFNLGATFAVMGGVQTLSTGLMTNATERTDYSGWELLGSTAFSAGMGYLSGRIMGGTKLSGVTLGRNSYMAVFKSGLSKLKNPTVLYTMSAKTILKGVAGVTVMRSGSTILNAGGRIAKFWIKHFMGNRQ